MNISNLLATAASGSLSAYFPYIIVIVGVLAAICLMNWFRNRKAEEHYLDTLDILKPGAKIKTMFGVFGEVVEAKEQGDTKYVLVKLHDGTVVEMDARGIFGLDERYSAGQNQEEQPKEEVSKEEQKEEPSEKPKRTRKPKSE